MTAPILVTGATGTIGSQVIDHLRARDLPVRALIRDAARAKDLEARGVGVAIGDLSTGEGLTGALAGVQRAFLLTPGKPHFEGQAAMVDAFLAAARGNELAYLVRHSIWDAGLEPEKPRAMRDHARDEAAIQGLGIRHTFLRSSFGMQSLLEQGMGATAAAEGVIYSALGEAPVAYVDLSDVAELAARCLADGEGHPAYELSGPRTYTGSELAAAFATLLGRDVTLVTPPVEAVLEGMRSQGMPAFYIEHFPELLGYNGAGPLGRVSADLADALGRPARDFGAFLARALPET